VDIHLEWGIRVRLSEPDWDHYRIPLLLCTPRPWVVYPRISLIITHRLVGLEWMDEILVLQNGRIAERGTHAGLLEAHGLYRCMWDLQSQVLV